MYAPRARKAARVAAIPPARVGASLSCALTRRAAADRPTEAFVLELPCAVIARTSESGGVASDARGPGLAGFRTRDGLRRAGAEGAARRDGEDSTRCPRRRGFGQAR